LTVAFTHLWIHIGSVALGSLMMTIVKIIKDAFDSSGAKENPCTKIIFAIISAILRLAEGVLEGLSNIGYAFMSVSGQPFISSVKNGFLLNLKHAMTFFFVSILAKFYSSMGVFFVTIANTVVGYFIITGVTKDNESLVGAKMFLPMTLIFLLSWLTARIFLG